MLKDAAWSVDLVRWRLQEEAALRLTQVAPGASDFRAMSIETQYYSRATPLFTVPKIEFSPVPDVNGLVVDFDLHLPEGRAVADAEGFLAMVSSLSKAKQDQTCCLSSNRRLLTSECTSECTI